jgi:serine/threonine protein kinase/WD40 repeat protein
VPSNCQTCGLTLSRQIGGLCPECVGRISVLPFGESGAAPRSSYLGDYELIEEIAQGGMGMIFKARQRSLNRFVALKLMRTGQFASDRDLKRFQSEADATAHLDHPNILPIYEIGTSEGRAFFAMKLMAGGSLRTARTIRAADPDATLRWAAATMVKVAQAIHFAHERGILHRDLKPENILLDDRGEPHVTDFGLAKRLAEDDAFTLPGAVLGTPAYMAPEQAEGKTRDVTTAADIYSLGAVLYFLLTGHAPFEAESALATMHHVLSTEVAPPSHRNGQVDVDLETICLKCLRKNAAERYRTAQELAEDLERWLRGEPIQARPSSAVEKITKWTRRHPIPSLLVLLVLLTAIVGFTGILWQWQRANREAKTAKEALEQARNSLWNANLERARSVRLTGEAGRRETALKAIRDASQIHPSPELRTEAIASLSLLDLGSPERFIPHPPGAERSQRDLFLAKVNRDLSIAAWPLSDNSFSFRNIQTAAELWRLPSADEEVRSAAWSDDDRYFAVVTAGGLGVWELATTNQVMHLSDPTGKAARFSPGSDYLAFITEDALRLIGLPNGKEQPGVPMGAALSFHPARPWLAVGNGREVTIWDYQERSTVNEFEIENEIETIDWSPDGRIILCAQSDKNLFGFDVFTRDKNIYEGHTVEPRNVTFAFGGRIFASSTPETNTRLWDTLSTHELSRSKSGAALRFSPDGKRLAFARPDGIGIWPVLSSPSAYDRLLGRMDFDLGNFMAFSPDSCWAFSISDVVPGVWVWNLTTRTLLAEPLLPQEKIYWLGFVQGRLLLMGERNSVSYRVNWDGPAPALTEAQTYGDAFSARFGQGAAIARDETQLFIKTSSTAGGICLAQDSHFSSELSEEEEIASVAFHPSKRMLAAGFYGQGGTRLYSLPDLRPFRTLGGLPAEVSFSPDGKWLANFTTVECEIWETGQWRKVRTLPRREAGVELGKMAFSRDGRWFVFLSGSHSCTLLETASWREVATFELPSGTGASNLAFSPNQEYLCLFGKAALHLYHLPSLRRELKSLNLDW